VSDILTPHLLCIACNERPGAPGDPDSVPVERGRRGHGADTSVAATEIILVRHGEAICNVEGVIGGCSAAQA